MEKKKPEYLIVYKCPKCGEQSSLADEQRPKCHYCDNREGLVEIERKKITAEVMEQQLKASAQRMFSNLQAAFESMTEEDKAAFGDKDAEQEMLLLLARAKKFKEEIDKLNLKEPDNKED